MEIRGADRQKVKVVTSDLSPSYIKAQQEFLPAADLVFDRFHLAQLLSKAVDLVRRREQTRQATNLKKTRYLWLKSTDKLDPGTDRTASVTRRRIRRLGRDLSAQAHLQRFVRSSR